MLGERCACPLGVVRAQSIEKFNMKKDKVYKEAFFTEPTAPNQNTKTVAHLIIGDGQTLVADVYTIQELANIFAGDSGNSVDVGSYIFKHHKVRHNTNPNCASLCEGRTHKARRKEKRNEKADSNGRTNQIITKLVN